MSPTQARAALALTSPVVDPAQLRRAWRRFALAHHPDLRPEDPDARDAFDRGREAYELLSRLPLGGAPGSGRLWARSRAAYAGPGTHRREWLA